MPKAKYEGIYHSIKKRIEAQDYPYQSLLPSENTLIEEYAAPLHGLHIAVGYQLRQCASNCVAGAGVFLY